MEGNNSHDRYSSILLQALNNSPSNIDLGGKEMILGSIQIGKDRQLVHSLFVWFQRFQCI